MTRLSGEAVHRILARARGERIEQFLQVVQASDLAGLASVLDDELLEFLRDLLSGEPGTGRSPVLERLRRAFPVVAEGEVEAATEVFRRLLEQALSEERRARPGRAPSVRLDTPAGPRDRPSENP
jgi:predicted pyridoxine 5'-phosphate oxidase superfamily flavin-nucleotide-binding protein